MLDPVRAKARIIGLTTAAFVGGILIASGMEWTTGSYASMAMQRPAVSDVRPMAELSEAFVAISESVTPAVVSIYTQRTERLSERQRAIPEQFRDMFRLPPTGEDEEIPRASGGSGFLISADGYVMTNNHVVEGAEMIQVTLHDRTVHDARIIGRDPTTDVAIIKMEGSGFPSVRFGDPHATRVGEWVLAIGNPLDLDFTVTAGIVSAKGRPLNILRNNIDNALAGYAVESFIQTDAAINPGNSGGPLVNIAGEVIGVNSAIASQTGLSAGYGFAVPIDLARRVADDLIRYGKTRRPILGVSIADVSVEDAEYFRLPRVAGVLVQDFSQENSPAQQAGIQYDDVIVAVDDRPITRVNELQREILTRRPGDEVELEVIRNGRSERARVRLMESEATAVAVESRPAGARSSGTGAARIGLTVEPVTAEIRAEGRFQGPTGGLLVREVERLSAADRAELGRGLRITHLDGMAVTGPEEFNRAIDAKRAGDVIALTMLTGSGGRVVATVRIPADGNGGAR